MVPDIPAEAIRAATSARHDALRDRPDPMVLSEETLTRIMLEAAAPAITAPLRNALAAVREAISIPHPATAGDCARHDEILNMRVMHATVFLESIDGRAWDLARSIAYFRARLAECPAEGYRTWDELVAEQYAREVREDGGRG
jgi:hypothetical protein